MGCHAFRKTLAFRAWETSNPPSLKVPEAFGHQDVRLTQASLKGVFEDAEIDAQFLAS